MAPTPSRTAARMARSAIPPLYGGRTSVTRVRRLYSFEGFSRATGWYVGLPTAAGLVAADDALMLPGATSVALLVGLAIGFPAGMAYAVGRRAWRDLNG